MLKFYCHCSSAIKFHLKKANNSDIQKIEIWLKHISTVKKKVFINNRKALLPTILSITNLHLLATGCYHGNITIKLKQEHVVRIMVKIVAMYMASSIKKNRFQQCLEEQVFDMYWIMEFMSPKQVSETLIQACFSFAWSI